MTCPHCTTRTPSLLAILGLLAVIGAAVVCAHQYGQERREEVVRREAELPVFIYQAGPVPTVVEPNHTGRRR